MFYKNKNNPNGKEFLKNKNLNHSLKYGKVELLFFHCDNILSMVFVLCQRYFQFIKFTFFAYSKTCVFRFLTTKHFMFYGFSPNIIIIFTLFPNNTTKLQKNILSEAIFR